MHPSMFNNLPDPEKILKGVAVLVLATAAVAFVAGYLVCRYAT